LLLFAIVFMCLPCFARAQDKWTKVTKDQEVEPQFMKDDLELYQDPKSDKICKIQQDLDDIKEVLHTTMQDLMARYAISTI